MKRSRALALLLALVVAPILVTGGRVEAAHVCCLRTGAPCCMRPKAPRPPSPRPTVESACCVRVVVQAEAPVVRQPDLPARAGHPLALRDAGATPTVRLAQPSAIARPVLATPRAGPVPLFLLTLNLLR